MLFCVTEGATFFDIFLFIRNHWEHTRIDRMMDRSNRVEWNSIE